MNVSPDAARDFARIARISTENLEGIVSDLAGLDSDPLVEQAKLTRIIASHIPDTDAKALERHLLSLASMRRARNLSIDECLKEVTPKVGMDDWTDQDAANWEKILPAFRKLLEMPALNCLEKVLALTFEQGNVFTSSKVVTDIRPIFNSERNSVLASLVIQSLKLGYYAEGEHREISIALDAEDLVSLIDDCKSALAKAKIAKTLMVEMGSVKTIVVGES